MCHKMVSLARTNFFFGNVHILKRRTTPGFVVCLRWAGEAGWPTVFRFAHQAQNLVFSFLFSFSHDGVSLLSVFGVKRKRKIFWVLINCLVIRGLLFTQSEKFLDLGTVTRPPCSIYARVHWSVVRDWCTRVQGHPRNLFRRPWIFGLSSQKHHTWPYHASVLWYTEANFSFQMQQQKFPRPYLRNDTMDFHF